MKILIPVTMPDGSVREMSPDDLILDGNCLISEGGKYYHTHVGCCNKWSSKAYDNFKSLGGWRLTSIEVAEYLGLMPCLICDEEIRERQDFSFMDDLDDDYE